MIKLKDKYLYNLDGYAGNEQLKLMHLFFAVAAFPP